MKLIVPLTFVAFVFGCMSNNTYKVEREFDEFDGRKIDRVVGNYLYDDGLNVTNSVWFNLQRIRLKDSITVYQIIIEYWDKEWLFIGDGESLNMLIDGERLNFSGEGSLKYRETMVGSYGALIKEKSFYIVSANDLKKIAQSKEVKIKIKGQSYFITRKFSKENYENVRKFVTTFVGK